MSIKVDLDALRDELAARERPAYLVTAGPEGPPHTSATYLTFRDGVIETGCGNSTARNLAARPAATITIPPNEPDDYTLIIDVTGEVVEGEIRTVRLTPTHAILHRPGGGQDGDTGKCGHDCAPVTG